MRCLAEVEDSRVEEFAFVLCNLIQNIQHLDPIRKWSNGAGSLHCCILLIPQRWLVDFIFVRYNVIIEFKLVVMFMLTEGTKPLRNYTLHFKQWLFNTFMYFWILNKIRRLLHYNTHITKNTSKFWDEKTSTPFILFCFFCLFHRWCTGTISEHLTLTTQNQSPFIIIRTRITVLYRNSDSHALVPQFIAPYTNHFSVPWFCTHSSSHKTTSSFTIQLLEY